jgi:hypothetical protein
MELLRKILIKNAHPVKGRGIRLKRRMKVLALDIDGVLNSRRFYENRVLRGEESDPVNEFDPIACGLLVQLIGEVPGLKILLSSTWRKTIHLDELETLVSRSLGETVHLPLIGKTGVFQSPKMSLYSICGRGLEIQSWLDKNQGVEGLCIIDDDSDMGALKPYLVKTSFEYGLMPGHLPLIKDKLDQRYERPHWPEEWIAPFGQDLTVYNIAPVTVKRCYSVLVKEKDEQQVQIEKKEKEND